MPALIAEIPANFAAGGRGSPASALGDVFGSPVNVAYFEHNNVFYFARSTPASQLKRLKIYFDVGSNDDYGFEQGGEKRRIGVKSINRLDNLKLRSTL